jgi:hypothetical protein
MRRPYAPARAEPAAGRPAPGPPKRRRYGVARNHRAAAQTAACTLAALLAEPPRGPIGGPAADPTGRQPGVEQAGIQVPKPPAPKPATRPSRRQRLSPTQTSATPDSEPRRPHTRPRRIRPEKIAHSPELGQAYRWRKAARATRRRTSSSTAGPPRDFNDAPRPDALLLRFCSHSCRAIALRG